MEERSEGETLESHNHHATMESETTNFYALLNHFYYLTSMNIRSLIHDTHILSDHSF